MKIAFCLTSNNFCEFCTPLILLPAEKFSSPLIDIDLDVRKMVEFWSAKQKKKKEKKQEMNNP